MTSTTSPELNDSPDGLPRRRAIQGIAGSLAGIAALGAISASGKKNKNKKKSKKGTLARFETAEETTSIPAFTILVPATTITATCPPAGSKEQVFATGGGYETPTPAAPLPFDFIARTSQATSNGEGWEVSMTNNTAAAQNVTVSVVCAYFKTK